MQLIWGGFLEEESFEKVFEGRRGKWLGFLRGSPRDPEGPFHLPSDPPLTGSLCP